MELCKLKDLKVYQKKKKKIFIYFYEEWCNNITKIIDSFFKEKYDLNKLYVKIKVSKSKDIIDYLDISIFPIIKIYNSYDFKSTLYCNCDDLIGKLNIMYNEIN